MSLFSNWRLRLFRWQQGWLYSLLKTRRIGPAQTFTDPNPLRVYAFLYASHAEYLVADRETRQLGLPSPAEMATDPERVLNPFFAVYRRSGRPFHRRGQPENSDNLLAAARYQFEHPEQDIEILPTRVFWGRQPDKEDSFLRIWLQNSGILGGRLLTLAAIVVNGRNTFVHFSRPLSLQRLATGCKTPEQLARKAALVLRIHFRQVAATVLGPDLSHRRTLIGNLPNRPLVQAEIHAQQQAGGNRQSLRREALKYADEIASNISYTTVRFMDMLLARVWNRLYDGVGIHNIENLKLIARDNTIVYVPCHRSHIDYLLLSYVLYHNGLQIPQIAAGINLDLPIVGSILRRSGAFFMRRSFRDNRLYAAVLDEYLHTLLCRGHAIEYFVEGGRSRSGRTLQPKAGMLAMSVRSYLRDSRRPVIFMPIYIGYEKIFEAGSYQRELSGLRKRKESLSGLISSLKSLRHDFGKVQVTFGKPIHLTALLNQEHPGWRDEDHARHNFRPEWAPAVTRRLAREIATGINAAASINPVNMMALVLLSSPRRVLSERSLLARLDDLARLLRLHPPGELVVVCEGNSHEWLQHNEQLGHVTRLSHPLGDLLHLNERQAASLAYCRNNVLHLLAFPALLCCLLRHHQPQSLHNLQQLIRTLYPLIKAELFLPWATEQLDDVCQYWLNVLQQQGYIRLETDQPPFYRAVDDRSEAYAGLELLARLLMPSLQRYYLVAALASEPCCYPQDELQQQSALLGKRLSLLYGLDEQEFADTGLFQQLTALLLEQEYLYQDHNDWICANTRIGELLEQLESLLDGDIRLSIRRSCQELACQVLAKRQDE
ncbi:glycerol-3-phosphate 1-O-acyltransferase PlsB [Parathalassolituus penaei]|uniref:Glycerol-3-phosphate acyltransferase n=1 Tax=Parathalassolituus penaei TaxID=2997323 RepID=A0A9X3EE71_9GAMM|nr:glycerol-3-phosphate 1-O-acyltransferase PlsB [Parathalassolituus penaei]MCY0965924.1 glycerol-3-phosphate 1-O-acyltransferase PlsB [Parathalassolituus penaei]